MKKVILAIIALVSVILGMLLIVSSSLNGVSADVNFVDGHEAAQWYSDANSGSIAIVNTTNVELVPPPTLTVTIINRVSH